MGVGLQLTFVEEDLAHELRSGQTGGVQEADGPEATSPQGEPPPGAPPALSCLQGKDRSSEEGERAGRQDTEVTGQKWKTRGGGEERVRTGSPPHLPSPAQTHPLRAAASLSDRQRQEHRHHFNANQKLRQKQTFVSGREAPRQKHTVR